MENINIKTAATIGAYTTLTGALCMLLGAALWGMSGAIAMYAGGLTTYGFLIIPVGVSWMIATSIVLFRQAKRAS